MAMVQIVGKRKLSGDVAISGSKNSVLPIMAASVLCQGVTILENCPDISDVHDMIKILESLGAKVSFETGTLKIDTTTRTEHEVKEEVAKKLRASILFLGPLLAKDKKVKIGYPGGCNIGKRPIDIHVDGLMRLNTGFMMGKDYLFCETFTLVGNRVKLRYPSVGATQNIMMAATLANGKTVIENAAKEPEIVYLARHLKNMGANILGEGSSEITIWGVEELHSCRTIIPYDRVVAATYLILAHVTQSEIAIHPIQDCGDIENVLLLLQDAGGSIRKNGTVLTYRPASEKIPIQLETGPYPKIPTDIQSMTVVMGVVANGKSSIRESVFEKRFAFAEEMKKMGADITVNENVATINGPKNLHGTVVSVPDLRAGAALCIAALVAEGETSIYNWELVERGYENFVQNLSHLGAEIKYC